MLALTARYMMTQLAPPEWQRFVETVGHALFERFGDTLSFSVNLNFANGRLVRTEARAVEGRE